jgi:hypothetical protein
MAAFICLLNLRILPARWVPLQTAGRLLDILPCVLSLFPLTCSARISLNKSYLSRCILRLLQLAARVTKLVLPAHSVIFRWVTLLAVQLQAHLTWRVRLSRTSLCRTPSRSQLAALVVFIYHRESILFLRDMYQVLGLLLIPAKASLSSTHLDFHPVASPTALSSQMPVSSSPFRVVRLVTIPLNTRSKLAKSIVTTVQVVVAPMFLGSSTIDPANTLARPTPTTTTLTLQRSDRELMFAQP